MEVVRTPAFWRDLNSIVDYFDDAHAQATALRFVDAVDETIQAICDFPDLGGPWESRDGKDRGLRCRLVVGFENYVVFYRRHEQHIAVARVLHGARNLDDLLG